MEIRPLYLVFIGMNCIVFVSLFAYMTIIDRTTITVSKDITSSGIKDNNVSGLFGGSLCRENIYNFEKSSSNFTIFNDKSVWKKCDINEFKFNNNLVIDQKPQVHTKCGLRYGLLLSRNIAFNRSQLPGYIVPNIVHYIIFGERFSFLNYLSFKSVEMFQKPQFIFVYGDGNVTGEWWERTLNEVPNIYHIYQPQLSIQGHRKGVPLAHMADVIRLYALLGNGGIYLDTDFLLIKSLDPMRRRYGLTMGRPAKIAIANSLIISAPNHPFICVWLHGYRDYNPHIPGAWGYYSVITAQKLFKIFPKSVHVEENYMHRPSWTPTSEMDQMFSGHYNWTRNYAMHIWKSLRPRQVPESPQDITHLNTTLGEVMRYVYYGNYTQPNVCEFCV